MDPYILAFVKYKCEMMPDGTTEIYDYKDTDEELHGAKVQEKILLTCGPENWRTWTVDCYQLYLWYCAWRKIASNKVDGPKQFMATMSKIPGVFVVTNWRYVELAKRMPIWTQDLNGKMFLGIRHNKYIDDQIKDYYRTPWQKRNAPSAEKQLE